MLHNDEELFDNIGKKFHSKPREEFILCYS